MQTRRALLPTRTAPGCAFKPMPSRNLWPTSISTSFGSRKIWKPGACWVMSMRNWAISAKPAATGGKVKVVIAGTNDKYDVKDGSLAGIGTFKASGAVTDTGKALAYRRVTSQGTLITLRFVAKGKKGTITYVVKIDTKAGTSRWTIASGTKAYKGLHGKGTETENGSYTISTLRGIVSGGQ